MPTIHDDFPLMRCLLNHSILIYRDISPYMMPPTKMDQLNTNLKPLNHQLPSKIPHVTENVSLTAHQNPMGKWKSPPTSSPGASASPAPRLCLHASALRYGDAVASLPWPADLRGTQEELRPMDPMARAALRKDRWELLGCQNETIKHLGKTWVKPSNMGVNHQKLSNIWVEPWANGYF